MDFDLIQAWRSAGLYRRFLNPGTSEPVLPSPGIGTQWPESLATAKKSPFGSPYRLSISPSAGRWGARKAEGGLTEEDLKDLYARIASLQKPATAKTPGEAAASQAAAAYAAHSTALPRRHRYDEAAPVPAATSDPAAIEATPADPASDTDAGEASPDTEGSWSDGEGSGDFEASDETLIDGSTEPTDEAGYTSEFGDGTGVEGDAETEGYTETEVYPETEGSAETEGYSETEVYPETEGSAETEGYSETEGSAETGVYPEAEGAGETGTGDSTPIDDPGDAVDPGEVSGEDSGIEWEPES